MKGLVLIALAALAAQAQTGMRDPWFRRYPFDIWVKEGATAQLKWQVRVPGAFLSPHQRLVQRIEARVETTEVERRRDHGEIIFLLEVSDATGRKWRTHEVADLRQIPADAKAKGIAYAQDLFILPGTYTVVLIVCDAKTKEHSLFRREVRVAPLKTDPLPDAWHDLPPIEFARVYGQPDAWFQPYVRGKLALQTSAKR
ncbi:MAG TPA: hypothetical protein VNH18_02255, partial [Bryobacteraceae bacterium]|nr:hypothetical protein [Bryobacteraceae bacterium]